MESILSTAIDYVLDCGLRPKSFVCDQSGPNRLLYKRLGITIEKPYFVHNNENIYGFFDPPHLLKSSRNNLMRNNAVYCKNIVKWDYIRMMYDVDSEQLPRAAPKLSNKHIYLPAFGEMKVRTATETMSATVAAAIYMYATTGNIPIESTGTAKYIKDIDNLFDIFNATENCQKNK